MLIAMLFPFAAFSEGNMHLDNSFGVGGIAKVAFGPGKNWVAGSATQADGKIVIAGSYAYEGFLHAIALARVGADGRLDKAFGDNGIVVSKIGVNSRAEKVVVLQDGRIAVAGWSFADKGKVGITLAMYLADGTPDVNFGERGVLVFPAEFSTGYVHSLAVQPDGKLVVGGMLTIRKEHREQAIARSVPSDYLLVARVSADGLIDKGFGSNGVVITDVGGGEIRLTSLTFQRDGKIVVSGTRKKGTESTLVLSRYCPDGVLDKDFGKDGLSERTNEKIRYSPPTVSLLLNGGIQVIGGFSLQDDGWLLVSQVQEDGTPDLNFGDRGAIATRTEFWKYSDFIPVVQSDGKILVAGLSVRPPKPGQRQPPFRYSIAVARFLQNGQIDSPFGYNGIQVVTVGSVTDKPASITLQSDGGVIVVGHSEDQEHQNVILIRLVPS